MSDKFSLLVSFIMCVACRDAPAVVYPAPTQLALGTWGGNNAGVIATDSVTHVHVACTFGDMPAHIALNAEGRFTVDGTFVLRAYPIAIGPPLPAQFSGQVNGHTLTLAIAVNDTVEKKLVALGPVSVVLGTTPQLGPCPICLAPKFRFQGVMRP